MDWIKELESTRGVGVVVASFCLIAFLLYPYIVDWWTADDIVKKIAEKQKLPRSQIDGKEWAADEDLQMLLDKQLNAIETMQKKRKILAEEQKRMKEAKEESHVLGRERPLVVQRVAKVARTGSPKVATAPTPANAAGGKQASSKVKDEGKRTPPAVLAAMAELDSIAKSRTSSTSSSSASSSLGAAESATKETHSDAALRAAQDAAYQESLEADLLRNAVDEAKSVVNLEKELLRRQQEQQEAADRAEAGEIESETDQEKIEDAKYEQLYGPIPEEPPSGDAGTVTIQFKIKRTKQTVLGLQLQDSNRQVHDTVKVVRRFRNSDSVRGVVSFLRRSANCKKDVAEHFELMIPFPKTVLFSTEAESNTDSMTLSAAEGSSNNMLDQTLEAIQIQNNSVLVVHSAV